MKKKSHARYYQNLLHRYLVFKPKLTVLSTRDSDFLHQTASSLHPPPEGREVKSADGPQMVVLLTKNLMFTHRWSFFVWSSPTDGLFVWISPTHSHFVWSSPTVGCFCTRLPTSEMQNYTVTHRKLICFNFTHRWTFCLYFTHKTPYLFEFTHKRALLN